MNAVHYEPGWIAWMLSLPKWMRKAIACHWRFTSHKRALSAEEAIFNAKLLRNEARRLEAAADWIEGDDQ